MRALRLDSVDLGKDAAPTTSNMRRTMPNFASRRRAAAVERLTVEEKVPLFLPVKSSESFWIPDPELFRRPCVRHEKQPSGR